jgi:undecaprenyl diphosphate synthase
MTLYAFSSDNWSRPPQEIDSIFWLMRAYLRLEAERLRQRGVRLQVIGRRDRLPSLLIRAIEQVESATSHGERLHLRLAVDYSSRDAISRSITQVASNSVVSPELARSLLTSSLTSQSGEVDLLIRTGGEKRLSNFLLWESAYAELLFSDRMWPDFNEEDLDAAVADFKLRERRFGAIPSTYDSKTARVVTQRDQITGQGQ